MPTDAKLEQYLSQLDKALGQIPVSDRSEIITEIKSHILESLERNPDQDIKQVLAAMGEPEAVANRYLIERGLRPGRPARTPMVKWLTIGFLGTMGMFLLFLVIVLWSFSPVIRIDEENERVTILGGMIDIDGKAGVVKIGDSEIREGVGQRIEGAKDLSEGFTSIQVPFRNGKFALQPSPDKNFKWSCKIAGPKKQESYVAEDKGQVIMNLDETSGAKCTLHIPSHVKLFLRGSNGKVSFQKTHFPAEVKLSNGAIVFEADPAKEYNLQANVVNGKVIGLESFRAPNGIAVDLKLTNGKILAEKSEN